MFDLLSISSIAMYYRTTSIKVVYVRQCRFARKGGRNEPPKVALTNSGAAQGACVRLRDDMRILVMCFKPKALDIPLIKLKYVYVRLFRCACIIFRTKGRRKQGNDLEEVRNN